jgi:hypothetical protein
LHEIFDVSYLYASRRERLKRGIQNEAAVGAERSRPQALGIMKFN